jgi:hypothetical protein
MSLVIKVLWFGFTAFFALVMACATIAANHIASDSLTLLTFPGLWCGLLITGGHGGTEHQELLGFVPFNKASDQVNK